MRHQDRIDPLVGRIDVFHATAAAAQRGMFRLIVEADRAEVWRAAGARDTAHWLAIRYGISEWKARRWVAAAHALELLPSLSAAFSAGTLGVDKVVELARFATPETEKGLVAWAGRVAPACVRRRADREVGRTLADAREAEKARTLSWWYFDDGRRFGLEAELPATGGALVARALERLDDRIPVMPGEEDAVHADARRADALVAMASGSLACDPDPDRATIVIHAQIGALSGVHATEIEDGPAIHEETARRLMCNARIQTVIEDEHGNPVRLGRLTREPPPWMVRQLRYRDGGCTFPGCGARRFTHAHHLVWWERGGRTDLDNLVLVCGFHHRLVHEHRWAVRRGHDGVVGWLRPDGTRYVAGPAPPARSRPDEAAA
jgi:hypothetical protein